MNTQPEDIFRANGGQLRMSEALRRGITRYTLYAMRDRGVIEQVSRGIYRLVNLPSFSNPDLVTVSLRFPYAVICLVSALAFHEITTQIPHHIHIAVPRHSRRPCPDYPPVRAHRFSTVSYQSGIDIHHIDGIPVKIYSPEKTLADCFKFRGTLGMDLVLEALKLYRTRREFRPNKLIEYASVCRVEKVMRPYLEATL